MSLFPKKNASSISLSDLYALYTQLKGTKIDVENVDARYGVDFDYFKISAKIRYASE